MPKDVECFYKSLQIQRTSAENIFRYVTFRSSGASDFLRQSVTPVIRVHEHKCFFFFSVEKIFRGAAGIQVFKIDVGAYCMCCCGAECTLMYSWKVAVCHTKQRLRVCWTTFTNCYLWLLLAVAVDLVTVGTERTD